MEEILEFVKEIEKYVIIVNFRDKNHINII